jgi:hypothetical protein
MKQIHSTENNTKMRTKLNTKKKSIEKLSSKETLFLAKMYKNLHTSFTVMAHLAEELCLSALLTLKVESSLICYVNTRMTAVSMIEWQLILPLKTLIRNKASRCRPE